MSDLTPNYPAPWLLTGNGVVIVLRLNRVWKQRYGLTQFKGMIASICLVNYITSPVGPYREILLIPGTVENPKGKHLSIAKIFVDSEQSMINGQQNWGIPKQMANFSWQDDGTTVRVHVKQKELDCFSCEVNRRGPSLPVHEFMLPITLYQERGQQHYWTKPRARGKARFAKIQSISGHMNSQGIGFPDVSDQQIITATVIDQFSMCFPIATSSVESEK